MIKPSLIITFVTVAALICSAAGEPDDTDGAAPLLRKSSKLAEKEEVNNGEEPEPLTPYEQIMHAQGLTRQLQQGANGGNRGPRPTRTRFRNSSTNDFQFRTMNADLVDGGCYADPFTCGCKHKKHSDYRGFIGVTVNGHRCKEWTNAESLAGQGLEDGPFCRNPHGHAEGAFCFVEDNRQGVHWEYCRVPTCDSVSDSDRSISNVVSFTSHAGQPGCVSRSRLAELETDVLALLDAEDNLFERSFHLGGIIRMVAHDFMDFNQHADDQMGMDGCIQFNHKNNRGLDEIWDDGSPWKTLYETKYSDWNVPDFWVAAATATIKSSSNGRHDMWHTFMWGRKQRTSCSGSGDRLPAGKGCQDNQRVFLDNMGLTWKDAVALLGAHTVGRGQNKFSGHHGTWVPNIEKAMQWDKGFYEELVMRAWAPRNEDKDNADFMAGPMGTGFPKMMLNTDVCLLFDIDTKEKNKCCTNINMINPVDGKSRCGIYEDNECQGIDSNHERAEAAQAVVEFLGGNIRNDDSTPWYRAFTEAWTKAVINGHRELWPAQDTC